MAIREMFNSMPGFELVATARNGSQLIAALGTQRCDLIVTDLVMDNADPAGDGIRLIRRLIEAGSGAPVVVFTMLIHDSIVQHLCRAGVAGIVSKNESTVVLGTVCEAVLGLPPVVLSPDLHTRLSPNGDSLADRDFDEGLSAREREVLGLFVRGLTLSEIAKHLNLSLSTVGMQKRAAMRKLRVVSDGDLLWVASITGID